MPTLEDAHISQVELQSQYPGQYVALLKGRVISHGLYLDQVWRTASLIAAGKHFTCQYVELQVAEPVRSGLINIVPDVDAP